MPQGQRPRGFAAKQRRRQHVESRVAKQQARREKAAARFTEPVTPKRARKIARAQANMEFRPLEQQIKSEIRGSAKREGDLGQWYGGLATSFDQDTAAAQQAFGTAEQAVNDRLAQEAGRTQTNLKELAASDATFAALVGGPKNSAGLSQMAEAAAAAERQRATLQAPITASRVNYITSVGGKRNAAHLRGIEARQGERERRRKSQQDLQNLGREKGSSMVKSIQTLREQEQDRSTEQEAFGVKEGYNRALEKQSRLGFKSSKVTANAQKQAAAIYSAAKERGASAQEVVARLQKEGKYAIADALKQQAKINAKGGGGGGGGYSVKEAKSFLRERFGKKSVSAQQAIDYLVNRGVDYNRAVNAVRQLAKG